jgi:hypothetical protein
MKERRMDGCRVGARSLRCVVNERNRPGHIQSEAERGLPREWLRERGTARSEGDIARTEAGAVGEIGTLSTCATSDVADACPILPVESLSTTLSSRL